MNFNAQLVGVCFDDRECTNPLACCWVLPVLPQTADPKVIEVSAKTVGELRKVTAWPETLAVTTPQERHADSVVK